MTFPSGAQLLAYARNSDPCRPRLPFPPDTRGFLYYHIPPKAPPFAGEIRFRRASDPYGFHNGEDLLSSDKTPWSISLFALANRSAHVALRKQLLTDNLVSPTTLDEWAEDKLPLLQKVSPVGRDRTVLYYLRQPFFLRFTCHYISFYTVTREDIGFCLSLNPFMDRRFKCANRYDILYSGELLFRDLALRVKFYSPPGSGLIQFEPFEDKVAMRVVKILEPVQDMIKGYDGYIHRPIEGELIRRSVSTLVTRRIKAGRAKDASMLPVNLEDLP